MIGNAWASMKDLIKENVKTLHSQTSVCKLAGKNKYKCERRC